MADRVFHKSWQDQRPGWRRRVRWYRGSDEDGIRLQFEEYDAAGTKLKAHRIYHDEGTAQTDYDLFVEGALTADLILYEQYDGGVIE